MKIVHINTRIAALAVLLALHSGAKAQIVNVESERIQTDTIGWAGSLKLGLNAAKEVSGSLLIRSQAHLEYKTQDHLFLLKGSVSFNRAGDETFSDNTFLHFRHNYKVNAWLRWEAFTQVQRNQITGIDFRNLYGTGPRFKIMKGHDLSIYAAAAYMFEHQDEEYPGSVIVRKNDHRISSYVTYTMNPADGVTLVHTFYYQPLLKAFGDCRVFSDFNLSFSVTKVLGFAISYDFLYDTDPVPGKPRFTYAFENQIRFVFGGKE
jgi:hypothetical protein